MGQDAVSTEQLAALCAPFPEGQIGWLNKGGRDLAYISARHVMNRLDEVLGPRNWFDEYAQFGDDGVKCTLSVRFDDGDGFISKSGIGGYAGMSDEEDNEKSAESSAFKRAAVKFGIGRYLYGNGVPEFCGDIPKPTKGGGRRTADPPFQPRNAPEQPRSSQGGDKQYDNFRLPKSGGGAFGWAKALGRHYGTDFLDGMSSAAKALGAPTSWRAWSDEQVQEICTRTIMYIKTLDNYKGEFDHIET